MTLRGRILFVLLAWATAGVSPAQVFPAPTPGPVPQGRAPGTTRMPGPGGGQLPFPLPGRKPKADPEAALQQMRGRVSQVDEKKLIVTLEDTRIIEFKLTKDTKYERGGKPAGRLDVAAGMTVAVAAKEDADRYFTAVRVVLESDSPSANAPGAEAADGEAPAGATTEVVRDRPGEYRPALRRGKVDLPPEREDTGGGGADLSKLPEGHPLRNPPAGANEPADAAPAPRVDPLIERARLEAARYSDRLPNFLCRQLSWRFQSEDGGANWSFNDMMTADVAYENGAEAYRAIQVGGKKVERFEDYKGAYSSGEFNTTLVDIFREQTAARFRAKGSEAVAGAFATVYDLEVDQPNAHWRIVQGSQVAYPSYRGSVSIDRKTARVMRIVMKSETLPAAFPLRMVEQTIEYGMVRIGAEEFLLPVRAENRACWRNSSLCANNRMEFRNYRRFAAKSEIFQTESKIDFEGGDEPKPQPKGKKK